MIIETLLGLGVLGWLLSDGESEGKESPSPSLGGLDGLDGLDGLYGLECMDEDEAERLYGECNDFAGLGATDEKGEKIRDVYQIITNLVLEKIDGESDEVPWRRPWSEKIFLDPNTDKKVAGRAQNFISKQPYRSVNALLLEMTSKPTPFWLTAKQIDRLGGKMKKGAKSEIVVFYFLLVKDENGDVIPSKEFDELKARGVDTDAYKVIPIPKYYRVFNLADTEGIKHGLLEVPAAEYLNEAIQAANDVVAYMPNRPKIEHSDAPKAFFQPNKDCVHMPYFNRFFEVPRYYSTLFHELVHSTKMKKRLDDPKRGGKKFGDELYAEEELVAELGAQFLAGEAGIFFHTKEQSAKYIFNWKQAIRESMKENKKWIFHTSSKAQKAADYILDDRKKKQAFEPVSSPKAEPKPKPKPKPKAADKYPDQSAPFPLSLNNIPFKAAEEAFRGTSFDPDKRALTRQRDYYNTVKGFYEELLKIATSDEKKKQAAALAKDFKEGYAKKVLAYLSAHSRVLSPMITGPAKFPKAKNEKANNAANKRMNEMLDYADRFLARAKKEIKGLSTAKEKSSEAFSKIQREILNMINLKIAQDKGQERGYDLRLFKQNLVGKIGTVVKNDRQAGLQALDFLEEEQKKLAKPLFTARHGVWKLRELAKKGEEKKENKTFPIAELGLEILYNHDEKRLQLFFEEKPDEKVRGLIKSHGFKWSRKNGAWQRILTENAKYAAKQLVKELKALLPAKKKSGPKPKRAESLSYALSELSTDPKRFQNRKSAFSKESRDRIVGAYESGEFDWALFDPITVWKDPDDGKHYVISGHSRLAAFRELAKRDKEFARIPAKAFSGSERKAVELALNSNTLSTKESDLERAKYYGKLRESGKPAKEVEELARKQEGRNAPQIVNLSYLNPSGFLFNKLEEFGLGNVESRNNLMTVANWVGEARKKHRELTNSHENELAKWLIEKAYGTKRGQFSNKRDFFGRLRVVIEKQTDFGKFKKSEPLNVERAVNKSPAELEHDKRLEEAQKLVRQEEKTLKEKSTKFYEAVKEGRISQAKADELLKQYTQRYAAAKSKLNEVGRKQAQAVQEGKKQMSLFGVKKKSKSNRRAKGVVTL